MSFWGTEERGGRTTVASEAVSLRWNSSFWPASHSLPHCEEEIVEEEVKNQEMKGMEKWKDIRK